jgi:4-hydroxybenzoate polyprenyltransferase
VTRETLLDLLRIRRVEFRIAEIPILVMPLLLAAQSRAGLQASLGPLIEGTLVFFLLFAFADMANCLADRDLDATYKPHLSQAVYRLGLRSVTRQILVAAALSFLITVHLAWRLERWILIPMTLIGLALGAAYSLEPVRLKSRGLWQIPCLWTIIFFGPMLYTSLLFKPLPSLVELAFFIAYATIGTGIVLVNTAEDFPEDRAEGVFTCIHALGLRNGMGVAALLVILGGLGTLATFASLYKSAGLLLLWLALPLLSISFVGHGITRLYTRLRGRTEDEMIAAVKASAKLVPPWITLNAWMHCTVVIVYFLNHR